MSDLQDDIDFVGTLTIHDVGGPLSADRIARVVDAARRVANAERAMVVASLWIEDERQWVMVLENDVDAAEGAPFYLVKADALTEDKDDYPGQHEGSWT